MISRHIQSINKWIKIRTQRERVLVILVGCAVIYMVWYFLITRPLYLVQKRLQSQIASLKTQIQSTHTEAETIVKIATEYSTSEKLQTQKTLSGQSENLQKKIEHSVYKVSVEENIEKVLKDILNQPSKGVLLVNIKSLADEALIPAGMDIKNLPSVLKNIVKHGIQVQIQSDYPHTIFYLNQLEKLTWRLYWDSLDYKVVNYPKADIQIKFYVLVNEKDNE